MFPAAVHHAVALDHRSFRIRLNQERQKVPEVTSAGLLESIEKTLRISGQPHVHVSCGSCASQAQFQRHTTLHDNALVELGKDVRQESIEDEQLAVAVERHRGRCGRLPDAGFERMLEGLGRRVLSDPHAATAEMGMPAAFSAALSSVREKSPLRSPWAIACLTMSGSAWARAQSTTVRSGVVMGTGPFQAVSFGARSAK